MTVSSSLIMLRGKMTCSEGGIKTTRDSTKTQFSNKCRPQKERKKERKKRERERMIEFAQREVILISNTPSRFIKLLNCVSLPLVQTPHLLFNVGSFSNFFKLKSIMFETSFEIGYRSKTFKSNLTLEMAIFLLTINIVLFFSHFV